MAKQSKASSKSASRPVSPKRQRKRDQSLSPKSAKMINELAKLRAAEPGSFDADEAPCSSVEETYRRTVAEMDELAWLGRSPWHVGEIGKLVSSTTFW